MLGEQFIAVRAGCECSLPDGFFGLREVGLDSSDDAFEVAEMLLDAGVDAFLDGAFDEEVDDV